MNTREDALLALLLRLEWSAMEDLAPFYMGGPPTGWIPACPICRGVNPDYPAAQDFMTFARGHTKDCELAMALGR